MFTRACMHVVQARCFKTVEIQRACRPFKCPCKRFDVQARRTAVITNMHIPVNRRLWTAIHATEALRIGHASCAEKYRSHRCPAIITIPTNYFIYPRMIAVPSVTPETYTARACLVLHHFVIDVRLLIIFISPIVVVQNQPNKLNKIEILN